MAMYLVHVVVYRLVGAAAGIGSDSSAALFVMIMIVSWALVVALSFPLTKLLDALTKLCMRPVEWAMRSADRFFEIQ